MSQRFLYLELVDHETCSNLLFSSLQNVSIFLYLNNVFFNPLFHNVEKWPNIL